MRILLLCPALFSSTGGIERILQLYLRTLLAMDAPRAQVRLAVLNDADKDLPATIAQACEAVATSGRQRAHFVGHAIRLARDCDRILCGHVHLLPLAALIALVYPKIRYALVAHGIEVWSPPGQLACWALRRAERILCVSAYTRGRMLELDRGLQPERLVVVPNALDPSFVPASPFDQAEKLPADPVILTVSRLSASDAYKGIDHLIQAMPFVGQHVPRARLRIVGEGDDRARLVHLADEQGCADRVTFIGRIDDAALREEFARCRLFALPSAGEGFGLVYLEAMASGRPCVAAHAGGAPEVVSSASGMLVRYGDVPQLGRTLCNGLTRAWDTAAIRARATEFYPERFAPRFLAAWPHQTN